MAIAPLLYEGEGITPRRIVVLQDRVLHKLVKQYFRRQGYESYTDEELVIRKRGYEGGYGKEEYPTPPTCLPGSESEANLSSLK